MAMARSAPSLMVTRVSAVKQLLQQLQPATLSLVKTVNAVSPVHVTVRVALPPHPPKRQLHVGPLMLQRSSPLLIPDGRPMRSPKSIWAHWATPLASTPRGHVPAAQLPGSPLNSVAEQVTVPSSAMLAISVV